MSREVLCDKCNICECQTNASSYNVIELIVCFLRNILVLSTPEFFKCFLNYGSFFPPVLKMRG